MKPIDLLTGITMTLALVYLLWGAVEGVFAGFLLGKEIGATSPWLWLLIGAVHAAIAGFYAISFIPWIANKMSKISPV